MRELRVGEQVARALDHSGDAGGLERFMSARGSFATVNLASRRSMSSRR